MPETSSASPPTLILRAAKQRFHTQLDWLDSWHSFSFAGHHDPAWMGFGPLRVINDDVIASGRGFGMHPHRDMEIVTVMVEGELTHADSMGHSAVLRAGEVQRMSAGTGIVHSEINRSDQACRLLQIWIEPERIGINPAYAQQPFAIGDDWTPLIDPDGSNGAMATASATRMWRARPQPQQSLALPETQGTGLWIQVIHGELELRSTDGSSQQLRSGDGAGLIDAEGGDFSLAALDVTADVLLLSLAGVQPRRNPLSSDA